MPTALAFFPWITVREPVSVGRVRILPYRRGHEPGDLAHVTQGDIDRILAAYSTRKGRLVDRAAILEAGDWHAGQEDNEDLASELFRAREFIAFAALAKRRLFRGHEQYCNFDSYALTVQRFDPMHPGTFSFTTRRRDGGTASLWNADEFAFFKPLHVRESSTMDLDEELLAALITADERGRLAFESIEEFNRANTDSAGVPIHIELVMTKSAFESLLDIGNTASEFVGALLPRINRTVEMPNLDGPMALIWGRRWPAAGRALEAWAREYCAIRGGAAHGQDRRGGSFVWSAEAHVAFASLLFPLLVRQDLVRLGAIAKDERKEIELERVEEYLMHDPFDPTYGENRRGEPHPWESVYSDSVLGELLRRQLARELGHP